MAPKVTFRVDNPPTGCAIGCAVVTVLLYLAWAGLIVTGAVLGVHWLWVHR